MSKDKFNFWTEIDFAKSVEDKPSTPETKYDNMVFEGVASDNSADFEGEIMEPTGFDFEPFLKYGYFNLDHLPTRSPVNKSRFWIGEPLGAKIMGNKFWVKGKLWKKSPEARAFWDKCLEMRDSGSSRKPGMSIEGNVIERDPNNPKRIIKAIINNIALTFNPVNYNSYLDLVKGKQQSDWIDYEFSTEKPIEEKTVILEYENDGNIITITKDFRIRITPKKDRSDKIMKKF